MQPYGNETKPGIVWTCPRRHRRRRFHDWPRDRRRWRERIRVERHLARHAEREHIAFELAAGETMAEAREMVTRRSFFGLSVLWRTDAEFDAAVLAAERAHEAEVTSMLRLVERERDADELAFMIGAGSFWDDPPMDEYDPIDDEEGWDEP